MPLFETIATAQNRWLRAVNRRLSFEVIPNQIITLAYSRQAYHFQDSYVRLQSSQQPCSSLPI